MLMSPDQRRTAVLLSSLKEGTSIDVHPKLVVESDQNLMSLKVTFVRLLELKNSLIVKVSGTGGGLVEVGVPLDEISVWFEGPEGDQCHMRCDRRLIVRR